MTRHHPKIWTKRQQGFVSSRGLCGWLFLRPPTLVKSRSQDSFDLPFSVFFVPVFIFGHSWDLDLFRFGSFGTQDLAAHHLWPYGHQRRRGEIWSLWISDAGDVRFGIRIWDRILEVRNGSITDGVGWHSPNICSWEYGCEHVPWPCRGMFICGLMAVFDSFIVCFPYSLMFNCKPNHAPLF